jgi:adenosine deaminase
VVELGHPFIVGIGLSGDEERYRPELFAEAYSIARENGLHLTAHAGEAAGPESIWGAIRHLGVERIDHGTLAIEDGELVEYLARHRITLTQCLSSNIRLNVVEDYTLHPFIEFYRRGVPVTLNTDDPQVFGVSLTEEYLRAAEVFSLGPAELGEIALNGIRAAFAPDEVKNRIQQRMERELRELCAPADRFMTGPAAGPPLSAPG